MQKAYRDSCLKTKSYPFIRGTIYIFGVGFEVANSLTQKKTVPQGL